MSQIKPAYLPKRNESIILLIIIISIISFFIIQLGMVPHIPILFSVLLLSGYGIFKKIPFSVLQEGITSGARPGIAAVFLFFLIGILIASWIVGGTIPVLMHAGIQLVGTSWFYAIVFIITAIIGTAMGSSLTTGATIGVVFISIAQALDVSLAITAGAIVSGAFFGDKMSPLSDTTNIASSIVEVDLFEHIKNMAWTTIPAFLISLFLFAIISPDRQANTDQLGSYQEGLAASNLLHWSGWIPIILLILLTIFKIPAFLTLAVSSITATIIAGFAGNISWEEFGQVWFSGYVADTGVAAVDSMLSRGGIESMLFTISLVLLALGLGGLLFTTGIIPSLLQAAQQRLTKFRSITFATAFTGIGANVLIGEQYLSILLTGEAYKEVYDRAGIARKKLSRTLEDAGTVINPLVPWSVCGVFLADVLGVPVLSYLPFAFFCLLSPVLTILIKGGN